MVDGYLFPKIFSQIWQICLMVSQKAHFTGDAAASHALALHIGLLVQSQLEPTPFLY